MGVIKLYKRGIPATVELSVIFLITAAARQAVHAKNQLY